VTDGQIDGQTDGSTALAMRVLWRGVKTLKKMLSIMIIEYYQLIKSKHR